MRPLYKRGNWRLYRSGSHRAVPSTDPVEFRLLISPAPVFETGAEAEVWNVRVACTSLVHGKNQKAASCMCGCSCPVCCRGPALEEPQGSCLSWGWPDQVMPRSASSSTSDMVFCAPKPGWSPRTWGDTSVLQRPSGAISDPEEGSAAVGDHVMEFLFKLRMI